jgi:hypothetical protein
MIRPASTRRGEQIGGGWFVFRRGKRTGRIGIRTQLPFEHPTREAALTEARRLADLTPGETYQVFGGLDQITSEPAELLTRDQASTLPGAPAPQGRTAAAPSAQAARSAVAGQNGACPRSGKDT